MIKLKVEEYCHNCPDFEADVTKTDKVYASNYDWLTDSRVELTRSDTIVTCAHANRCRAVKRYLEKQQKGES